jgi:uncharacterized Zn finger protein
VTELVMAEDGRLLATVTGRESYATSVGWQSSDGGGKPTLQSRCTCPVGYNGCKHAVAVVAEYLQALHRRKKVARADPQDPRWDELDSPADDGSSSDTGATGGAAAKGMSGKIREHLRAKSHEELVEMLCGLAERYPELAKELRERITLASADVDRLVAQTRKEIRRVTGEFIWRNHWTGEGSTPSYETILRRLERLLELGHPDKVVSLGRLLIVLGTEQAANARDHGETASELRSCLPVFFEALQRSSLEPARKLLMAIDLYLEDEYDFFDGAADPVLDAEHRPEDWSAVADELAKRLRVSTAAEEGDDDEPRDFGSSYRRDQASHWLAQALTQAGRGDEVLALYEQEAERTNSYERVVKLLIEQGRTDDAKRWAETGIARTAAKLPGIAQALVSQLCDLAEREQRWDVVAAHAAHALFERPSSEAFRALMDAARKTGCEDSTRAAAMRFLETGVAPIRLTSSKGSKRIKADEGWPLPVPDYLATPLAAQQSRPGAAERRPHFAVLIGVAIAEKRLDDALQWYDRWHEQVRPAPGSLYFSDSPAQVSDRVAAAVAGSHPRRALEIYRQRIGRLTADASAYAYEAIAAYLRKMRPIYRGLGVEAEWTQLVQHLREKHRNRPRFLAALDHLGDRPILSPPRRRS